MRALTLDNHPPGALAFYHDSRPAHRAHHRTSGGSALVIFAVELFTTIMP